MDEKVVKVLNRCLVSALVYNIVMLFIIIFAKRTISKPAFFLGMFVCVAITLIGSVNLNEVTLPDQNERESVLKLINAFENATPFGIEKTGVSINSAIGGLILIRDTPQYREVFGDSPFREVKVLVDDDCYIEGIGALSSAMPERELPENVDIVSFLPCAAITDEEFLGYRKLKYLGRKSGVQNDWHNVEIDGKPSAFLVRDEKEPHELIGDALKDWRKRQLYG